jgi:hypothetical protein
MVHSDRDKKAYQQAQWAIESMIKDPKALHRITRAHQHAHLTPMHEGGAFGDLRKEGCGTGTLGLMY